MRRDLYNIVFFIAFLCACPSFAQNRSETLQRADKLRLAYDFNAASALYSSLLDLETDDAAKNDLMEKIALCENGQSMLSYATKPETVQKKIVPAKDFHLWYSHLNSWRKLEGGDILLYNDGDKRIVFSVTDGNGKKVLNQSFKINDTLWSAPEILGEAFNSAGNEILPVISSDGKHLYFSSDGLYGMGGYDIFESTLNESDNTWSVPENMGFPFSSPYDDYMFSPTADKSYTLFASNRECSRDSMVIYVLKYDSNPVKVPLSNLNEIREIAAMKIVDASISETEEGNGDSNATAEDPDIKRYKTLLGRYKAAKDSLAMVSLSDAQIQELTSRESRWAQQLLDIEMDLLIKGKSIKFDDTPKTSETAPQDSPTEYKFIKRRVGSVLNFSFEPKEEPVNFTFRIEDESEIVTDFTLPEGIVYQIQLSVSSSKSTAKKFKGISPIFETHNKSGKYLYTAGLFYRYADAQASLTKVKKAGFSSAFIVAYNNGKSMSLANARAAEKKNAETQKYRIVFNEYGDGIPAAILSLIRSRCDKDIARAENNGAVTYLIAPFSSKGEAQELADYLITAGAKGITVESY
ncbi:MAG: PD40 domain-containing protein [Bacteroidales bacterium]|nr:PD40 domain-containing protein [Bacteroidales bacterium]